MSNAVDKICPLCGKSFVSNHGNRVYCSFECTKNAKKLKRRERHQTCKKAFEEPKLGCDTYHKKQYTNKYKEEITKPKKPKEFKLTREQLDQRERLKIELLIRRDTAN